jgi:light-harvesting complex 1 beta chain
MVDRAGSRGSVTREPGDDIVTDQRKRQAGPTDPEAREFQRNFVLSFLALTTAAVVAHILMWTWRPWL